MNSKLFFGSAFAVLCGLALPPVCQVAVAAENTVTDQGNGRSPSGLARASLGAQIQVSGTSAKADVRVLIGDDASRDFNLSAGTTSFVVSLSRIEVLNHFTFTNNGAEGKVTVSVSNTKLANNAPGWHQVGGQESFGGHQIVDCNFGSAEGRYVKLDFETRTAGQIAGFDLIGAAMPATAPAQVNYVTTPTRTEVAAQGQNRGSFYNYASASMGAKVVAVSHADSLAAAQYMLDGTESAAFTFDPADPNPTVVVDLGARRVVNRVTCAFEAPAGQLDFYLVDNAYSKDDAAPLNLSYVTPPGVQPVANAETLNYNADTILASHKPAGSVATTGAPGVNHASVTLNAAQGRFLIASLHRGGRRRSGDFKDTDFKDFKDKNVAIADNPVKVEGISAFGEPPGSETTPLVPPSTVTARRLVSP